VKITKRQLRRIIRETIDPTSLNEWEGFKAMGRSMVGREQPNELLKDYWMFLSNGYQKALDTLESDIAAGAHGDWKIGVEELGDKMESAKRKFEKYSDAHKAALDAPKGSKIRTHGQALQRAIEAVLLEWEEQVEALSALGRTANSRDAKASIQDGIDSIKKHRDKVTRVEKLHR